MSLLLPTRLAGKDLTREKNKGERDSNCFNGFSRGGERDWVAFKLCVLDHKSPPSYPIFR